jgi:hypothetical protein
MKLVRKERVELPQQKAGRLQRLGLASAQLPQIIPKDGFEPPVSRVSCE